MKTNVLMCTKISLKIIVMLGLALSLVNCSKDDDPAPVANPEVNPLASYLTATGFDQVTTNFINSGIYEFGLSFTPSVNGKMTAIVAKIPDAQPAMRVSIWNKTTSTLLRTETVNVANANVEVTKAITALDLVAGTEYYITYNGDDWYQRKRTDNANVTYPITVGDLVINGYRWLGGSAQVIPTNVSNNYYAGDLSFKFVKN